MARYDYRCNKCGIVEEYTHSMKENPDIRCMECGEPMERLISYNFGGFSIKGGSSSIHWKEKRNHAKKNEELDRKQKERYGEIMPAPNIAGVRQESWADAQKLAKESGLNADSYTPMVEKEKKNKKPKIYTGR